MREIKIIDKVFPVPGEWNELTVKQLRFLTILLNGESTAQEIKIKMLLFAMNVQIRNHKKGAFKIKHGRFSCYITADQLTALSAIYDFLFTENEEGKPLFDIRLTKNPLPYLKAKDVRLFGPEDGLTNLSYGQYVMLQTWHQRISGGHWDECIDEFLSVIYKPGKFSAVEEGDASLFKTVSPHDKLIAFWFYLGCMAFIREKFSRVFSQGDSSGGDIFDAQMRLIDELAGNDVTKKPAVKESLLYDAFYTLDMAIEKVAKNNKNL